MCGVSILKIWTATWLWSTCEASSHRFRGHELSRHAKLLHDSAGSSNACNFRMQMKSTPGGRCGVHHSRRSPKLETVVWTCQDSRGGLSKPLLLREAKLPQPSPLALPKQSHQQSKRKQMPAATRQVRQAWFQVEGNFGRVLNRTIPIIITIGLEIWVKKLSNGVLVMQSWR